VTLSASTFHEIFPRSTKVCREILYQISWY